MKTSELTFANEENLPSLPLPTIENTVNVYLDSCKAVLKEQEYTEAWEAANQFKNSPLVAQLHEKLKQRSQLRQNWLEKWWLDKGYLELRVPSPLINYSGPASYLESFWPLKKDTQLERSAWNIYFLYQFWHLLRKEKLPVHVTKQGNPLSMNQFRCIFNGCRRPGKGRDKLIQHFRTESEGECPSHAVVMKGGRVFIVDCYNKEKDKIVSPRKILRMLEIIEETVEFGDQRPSRDQLGVLTTLGRDKWAEVRNYLTSYDQRNEKVLETIEESVFVFCLDDSSPVTYTEMSRDMAYGNFANRWYDKSYSTISSKNGGIGTNCDHAPTDAMVMAVFCEFVINSMKKVADKQLNTEGVHLGLHQKRPEELTWHLDERLKEEIADAKKHGKALQGKVEIVLPTFKAFGKKLLKSLEIHPDFAVQISLQLTYMQIHGRPAPTYETATTRKFYHGRTETCRTCTPEAVRFCEEMLRIFRGNPTEQELSEMKSLLLKAQQKFLHLMQECCNARGCDRHLYGIQLIAEEENSPVPKLFSHPSFEKSGGGGNFLLSTSCLGYGVIQGVVAPMTTMGYGTFYRINDERIVFSVTSYTDCDETNSQQFADVFMLNLVRVAKVGKSLTGSKI